MSQRSVRFAGAEASAAVVRRRLGEKQGQPIPRGFGVPCLLDSARRTHLTPPLWPQVFEWVMCSSTDLDSHRFMDLIEGAIQAKEVPATKKFTAWAKKVAARPQPDPLAPPKRGKKGGGRQQQQQDEMALIAQIRYSQLRWAWPRQRHPLFACWEGQPAAASVT